MPKAIAPHELRTLAIIKAATEQSDEVASLKLQLADAIECCAKVADEFNQLWTHEHYKIASASIAKQIRALKPAALGE